ncbi:hypothetical protein JW911_01970 [Candidatus Peregrinibacteria bacterium]|nr:hypothetical protein [Candidatus Peregrinibacteria bacterium]
MQKAADQTYNSIKRSILPLLSVLLAIALFMSAIPKNFYNKIFTGNGFLDPLTGALFGSVAAGNPVNSYVIGGELLNQGIGLAAVTAFILSWVTVGVIQLPAEILMLGKKFALLRNLFSFISAIIIAILVAFILSFI